LRYALDTLPCGMQYFEINSWANHSVECSTLSYALDKSQCWMQYSAINHRRCPCYRQLKSRVRILLKVHKHEIFLNFFLT
jgi:hypothetical protein